MELSIQFGNFLKGKTCKLYASPFDVRLNTDGEDDTVVQPDLVVVCDPVKLDDRGCKGAPDLVLEIVSPSSSGYDKVVKLQRYLAAGVREYWIVDPGDKTLIVCILENGRYVANAYGDDAVVPVHVLEGCEISLQDVFAQ